MRIRHDAAFISSVLFTIVLVYQIRWAWWNVMACCGERGPDLWRREALRSTSEVGELILALIIIGLIVTWTGYFKKVRWTWFVMFVVVSGLTIPLGVFPWLMHPKIFLDLPGTLVDAWRGQSFAWAFLEPISIFLLMVIALFLPVKSFFFRRTGPTTESHL